MFMQLQSYRTTDRMFVEYFRIFCITKQRLNTSYRMSSNLKILTNFTPITVFLRNI